MTTAQDPRQLTTNRPSRTINCRQGLRHAYTTLNTPGHFLSLRLDPAAGPISRLASCYAGEPATGDACLSLSLSPTPALAGARLMFTVALPPVAQPGPVESSC